jgi:eukaryotic-like serine/threonine-protein kinase
MALSRGDRLGPYEIIDAIGAGGMGEVYKARDTRLDRIVAVKTAKDQFSERFEREARAVAALNHPNICTLHDVGPNYLVMEYIEGATLSVRLASGPLTVAEALPVARQIAEALEAAHEKGIVHRDLKPANIKLTPDGKVKVLDFGLAKAFDGDSGGKSQADSPTLTLSATRAGMILGTAGYMSPEQARGVPADKRADIWSYGVVLFEMLTGRQTFSGETVSDTLAAVLRADLDWKALPADTPPAIRRLLRRCLERDRKKRLPDIAVARLEIDEPEQVPATSTASSARSARLPWAIAAAGVLAAIVILSLRLSWRPPPPDSYQISLVPPDDVTFAPLQPQGGGFALSPDGQTLAFVGSQEGAIQIWLRRLDVSTARPVPGTAHGYYPFWSPDGRYLGFFADGKLKKIDVSGGPAQVLCDVGVGRGATWSPRGVIVFAASERVLHRVPAAGGQPVSLTTLDKQRQENAHYWPSFLPDGNHLLYLVRRTTRDQSAICVGSLEAGKGSDHCIELVKATGNAVFAPAAAGRHDGWLVFARGNTLLVQRLDSATLKLEGEAVPLTEGVGFLSNITRADFSLGGNGVLIYGRELFQIARLVWIGRDGKESPVAAEPGAYQMPSLSPDASRVAVTRQERQSGNDDIWIIDTARALTTRFTFDPNTDFFPVWSPDGRSIAFSSTRNGFARIFLKPSSGDTPDEMISPAGAGSSQIPTDWSHDGRFLLFSDTAKGTGSNLRVLTMTGERQYQPFLETPFNEGHGQFSPDDGWVAYDSDESGRSEVYVRRFAGAAAKFQVSTNGGTQPHWRGDGKELFFLTLDGKLMATPVKIGATSFEWEPPRALFEQRWMAASDAPRYDVTRDGQRFLFVQRMEGQGAEPLTLWINWQSRLGK